MDVTNIYSKRQRKSRGESNDIYQYNIIPDKLKKQICHILNDTVGLGHTYETLRKEPKRKTSQTIFMKKLGKYYSMSMVVIA